MGGGAPSPPAVFDPTSLANNQQNLNLTSAEQGQQLSMVNQENPWGSLNYSQTGTGANGLPIYTSSMNLNPQLEAILNSLQSGMGNLLTTGGYNAPGANPGQTIGDATTGNTAALVQHGVDYLKPFYTQETDQLDTKLRNQGLLPGQPGYDNAMRAVQANQNQNVNSLITQFEPTAYSQATSNYYAPLTTAAAEMGLITPTNTNALVNPPQTKVNPADLTGATEAQQTALNNQYQQQVAANSATQSGLFGIPTAILGGWARGGGLSSAMSALPFLAV